MIEAMKNALEALEGMASDLGKFEIEVTAIAVVRQAITEAEQGEPVLWLRDPKHYPEEDSIVPHVSWKKERLNTIPLYTHPQPRKQLTDEQIDAYLESEWTGYDSYHDCFKEIVRWTEAKHGIKE